MIYTADSEASGDDRFDFSVSDGELISAVATVTIKIAESNTAPTARDQNLTTDEDVDLNFTLLATDPDGDTLTYEIIRDPYYGVLSGTAPNLTYRPNANAHGIDRFEYKVRDGFTASSTGIVTITVKSVNDAPELAIAITGGRNIFRNDEAVTFTASKRSDIEDGTLAKETLSWSSSLDGSLGTGATITATLSQGEHRITVSGEDQEGLQGSSTVEVEVVPAPEARWFELISTPSIDRAVDVAIDGAGGIYTVGTTFGEFPGTDRAGPSDIFIVKHTSGGERSWARQFGSPNYDNGYGLAIDDKRNVYVVGETPSSLPNNSNAGENDAVLAKYDSEGNQQWVKQFGGAGVDIAFDVAVDQTGNIYVSGLTTSALFGSGGGDYDILLAKYNSDGTQQWVKQFGDADREIANDIAIDAAGDVYLTGYVRDATREVSEEAFLAKYDSSGNERWMKLFGTTEADAAVGLTTAADGGVYIVGNTEGKFTGYSERVYQDLFLVRYDTTGTQQWVKQFKVKSTNRAADITVDSDGHIFIVGEAFSSVRASEEDNASTLAFLVKFDSGGVRRWTEKFGSVGFNNARGIAVDDDDNVYLAGHAEDTFSEDDIADEEYGFLVRYVDYDSP